MSRKVSGQIPEWPNGADCKSAVFRLRWFESIFAHSQLMTRQERESKRFSLSFFIYIVSAFGYQAGNLYFCNTKSKPNKHKEL